MERFSIFLIAFITFSPLQAKAFDPTEPVIGDIFTMHFRRAINSAIEARSNINNFDYRIQEARKRYWHCLASCAPEDRKKAEQHFSELLFSKDFYYFNLKFGNMAATGNAFGAGPLDQFIKAVGEVDNGIWKTADFFHSAWSSCLRANMATGIRPALNACQDRYLLYKRKRDKAEYENRPVTAFDYRHPIDALVSWHMTHRSVSRERAQVIIGGDIANVGLKKVEESAIILWKANRGAAALRDVQNPTAVGCSSSLAYVCYETLLKSDKSTPTAKRFLAEYERDLARLDPANRAERQSAQEKFWQEALRRHESEMREKEHNKKISKIKRDRLKKLYAECDEKWADGSGNNHRCKRQAGLSVKKDLFGSKNVVERAKAKCKHLFSTDLKAFVACVKEKSNQELRERVEQVQ